MVVPLLGNMEWSGNAGECVHVEPRSIAVYRCIRSFGLRGILGESVVTITMVRGIGGMVNCTQRTITHSDSMYGVGKQWRQQKIRVHCDNAAVVEVIRAGYAKDPHLMQLLRCIFFVTASFKIMLFPVHVPGVTNKVAHAISRNNIAAFRSGTASTPMAIPPEVVDILIRQSPNWTSQAWSQWFSSCLQQAYVAQSIKKVYGTGGRRYLSFCDQAGVTVYPETEQRLMLFAAFPFT